MIGDSNSSQINVLHVTIILFEKRYRISERERDARALSAERGRATDGSSFPFGLSSS